MSLQIKIQIVIMANKFCTRRLHCTRKEMKTSGLMPPILLYKLYLYKLGICNYSPLKSIRWPLINRLVYSKANEIAAK